jgi:hypothetical protein
MDGDAHQDLVPSACVSSIAAMCLWHLWMVRDDTRKPATRRPVPPPLVPMVIYAVGNNVSFLPERCVPRMQIHRRASTSPARSPPLLHATDDAFIRAIVQPRSAQSPLASRKGLAPKAISPTPTKPREITILASTPCRVAALGLSSVSLTPQIVREIVSACGTGLRQPLKLRSVVLRECSFLSQADFAAIFTADDSGSVASLVDPECIEEIALQFVRIRPYESLHGYIFSLMQRWQGVTFPRLVTMDFCFNDDLGDDAVACLVAHSLAPQLRTLRLALTSLSDRGLQSIAEWCVCLTALSIANCASLTDVGLAALAQSACAPRLLELTLSFTKVTNAGLMRIGARCRALRTITLRGCSVGDDGVAAIAIGCGHLEHLDIDSLTLGKGIGDETLSILADRCASLSTLLAMNSVRLTESALVRFAESRNSGVAALNLRNTAMSSRVMQALSMSSNARARHLQRLDLSGCKGFDDAAFTTLAASELLASHLVSLDISHTSVTPARVAVSFVELIRLQIQYWRRASPSHTYTDADDGQMELTGAVKLQRFLCYMPMDSAPNVLSEDGLVRHFRDCEAKIRRDLPVLRLGSTHLGLVVT